MKYIPAEKLIAEIERRKQIHKSNLENGFPDEANKIHEDDNILSIIISLQQEQQEVDLNDYRIADIIQNLFPKDQFIESESLLLDKEEAILFARYFYELGESIMRERLINPEFNQKIIEKMKSEYPVDESNARKEE